LKTKKSYPLKKKSFLIIKQQLPQQYAAQQQGYQASLQQPAAQAQQQLRGYPATGAPTQGYQVAQQVSDFFIRSIT